MPSSVVSIPNQPLIFSAPSTDECNCGERNQCVLVQPEQDIYAQFKLQPCGTVEVCNNSLGNELVCNGGFELEPELVTNGSFDGDASGWTLGVNWAYGTNNVCATSAGIGETISQTLTLTPGNLYRVAFEVENDAADGGDIRPELGGTNGASVVGDGTYEQFIIAGAGTDIVFNNVGIDFTGCITNVSVRELPCWTFGAPWAWSAGAACSDGAGIGNILSQTINPTNGSKYIVTFDLTGNTQGNVILTLGGTAYPTVFQNDGTYGVTIISGAGTDIEFTAASSDGCIDNVSVKEIVSCWDADEVDWILNGDGACHVPGNTTNITNTGTVITVGLYYHFTFVVSGSTAGGVSLRADTAAIGAQTSGNGTFERWGEADGTSILFTPSSDFDGCVSALEVVQYNTDYVFHLLTSDGDFVEDITGEFLLDEDVLTLSELQLQTIEGIDYGCFKICMIDGCYGDLEQVAANIIENGDFSAGAFGWASDGVTFAAGTATLSSVGHSFLEQNIKITTNVDCMRIRLGYSTAGQGTLVVKVDGVTVYQNLVSGSGSIDVTTGAVNAGALVTIEIQGATADITIDNVIIDIPAACRMYDQCSPCIKYVAEFDCTKLVEGYCDGNAFNFRFDLNGSNIFKLSLRVKSELYNSSYNQEQSDYTFSTGVSSLNYASSEKIKTLFIQPIPEYKHDTLALIKVCDHIFVDLIEYFSPKGEYVPEWNRSILTDLAQSKMELKVKDQTLFNSNCS